MLNRGLEWEAVVGPLPLAVRPVINGLMNARTSDRYHEVASDRIGGLDKDLARVSLVLLIGAFFVVAAFAFFTGWIVLGGPADSSGGCGEMCGLVRLMIAAAVAVPLLVVGGVLVAVGTVLSIRKQNRRAGR